MRIARRFVHLRTCLQQWHCNFFGYLIVDGNDLTDHIKEKFLGGFREISMFATRSVVGPQIGLILFFTSMKCCALLKHVVSIFADIFTC